MDLLVGIGGWVTGGLGFVAALAALKGQWDLRAMTNQHEKDLVRLRSDLGIAETRLQHALSLGGEVHLRLFERAAESTMNALHAMDECVLQIGAMRNSISGAVANLRSLINVNLFLPPELDVPFLEAAYQLQTVAVELGTAKEANMKIWSDADRDRAVDLAVAQAGSIRENFEHAARRWKSEHWNRYLAPEAKTDAR